MPKQTLKFPCFGKLSAFVKPLSIGYLINTNTLTITAKFSEPLIQQAVASYEAELIETNERVYSYDA